MKNVQSSDGTHTHTGWVIGQPPGCMFGSLSKQYGASPAALCKHSGLDPMRSKNSFSESSLKGCHMSLCGGNIKVGRDTYNENKSD